MKVMTRHTFFDIDVEEVLLGGHENNREIVFKHHDHDHMLINKEDVIALAKEFNLIVFDENASL